MSHRMADNSEFMEITLHINDVHQAIELATFCGGFLATNEDRACITPVLKELFVKIMDELPVHEKQDIEDSLKVVINHKEALKTKAKALIPGVNAYKRELRICERKSKEGIPLQLLNKEQEPTEANKNEKKLKFNATTGELLITDKETINDKENIVIDQIYKDGFFS